MYTEEDMKLAEDAIENSLQYLRGDFNQTSLLKRNQNRKTIKNEMAFLKEHFPESYILKHYMGDVDLNLESTTK